MRSLDPSQRYQINEFDPVTFGGPAFGLALQLERDRRPCRRRAVG